MANFTPVGVQAVVKDFGKFQSQLGTMDKSIQKLGDTGEGASAGVKKFAVAVAAAAVAAAAAAAGIVVAATRVATQWEDSFADVVRTTDNLGNKFGELTPLGEEVFRGLRNIAMMIPVSVESLTEVAAIAGKMGIAEESIVEFTEIMARMADVTDLSATQASQALAQFAAIMGTSGGDVERLASTIVALGNAFPPSEAAIVRMVPRLAFLGKQAGLSEIDVLALATATQTLGFRSQAASTAMVRAFLKMGNAVKSGNDDLAVFAAAAQMTVDEFVTLFEENAIGAFIAFIDGLGNQTAIADEILQKLGMASARYEMVTLGLAASQTILVEAWELANAAWEDNTALAVESGKKYSVLAKQLNTLGNIGQDVLGSIGIPFREMLKDWLEHVIPVARAFAMDLPNAIQQHLIPRLTEFNRIVREDIVPWLIKMGEWIVNSLVPALADFGKVVGDVAALLKPFVDLLISLEGGSILLTAQIVLFAGALWKLHAVLQAIILAGGISGLASALPAIAAGALAALGPIGLLVIAIGGLVVVVDQTRKALKKQDEQIERAIENIRRWSDVTTEILDEGRQLTDATDKMADAINKASEAQENQNLFQQLGLALSGRYNDQLTISLERLREVQNILVNSTSSYATYLLALQNLNAEIDNEKDKILALTQAEFDNKIARKEWIRDLVDLAREHANQTAATEAATEAGRRAGAEYVQRRSVMVELTEATKQANLAFIDSVKASSALEIAMAQLDAALEAGTITAQERADMEQALQLALGLTSQAAVDAKEDIRLLTVLLAAGRIDADGFAKGLESIAEGKGLPDFIRHLAGVIEDLSKNAKTASGAMGAFGTSLDKQVKQILNVAAAGEKLIGTFKDGTATTLSLMSAEDGLARVFGKVSEATKTLFQRTSQLEQQLRDATSATGIMEIATEELKAAEDAGIITTIERIAMEQALQIALGLSTESTYIMVESIRTLVKAEIAGIITTQEFLAALGALREGGTHPLLEGLVDLESQLGNYNAALLTTTTRTGGAGSAAKSYTDKLNEQRQALQGVIIGHLELAERLIDPEATTIAKIGIDDLRQAYEQGLISFDDYAAGLEQIQDGFGLVTPESRKLANALGQVRTAMRKGLIKAEDYDDILMEVFKRAQEGTLDMEALLVEFGILPEEVDPATEAVDEFGNRIMETPIDEAKRKLMELPATLDTVQAAYTTAGPAMVKSFAAGYLGEMTALIAAAAVKWAEFAAYVPQSEPKNPNSPLRGWEKSGEMLIENFASGVRSAGPILISDLEDLFKDVVEKIDDGAGRIGKIIGDVVDDVGDGIGRLIDMLPDFAELIDKIGNDMEKLFGAGSVFGGLGDIAAEMFSEQFLDPLKDSLKEVDEQIEGLEKRQQKWNDSQQELLDLWERRNKLQEEHKKNIGAIKEERRELEQQLFALNDEIADLQEILDREGPDADPELYARLTALWEQRAELVAGIGGFDQDLSDLLADLNKEMAAISERIIEIQKGGLSLTEQQELLDLYAARAELSEEIADNEARILELQKKQQQLDFLEQQFALLELIKEHGLDASEILGGLVLGVDANLADVIDAMVLAMGQIVEKINAELQIASPSQVFKKIGGNMMLGLMTGWADMADKAQGIMGASLVPAPVTMAPTSGGSSSSNQSVSNEFNTTITNGMEMAQFEQRVLRVVGGSMAR